MADRRDYYKTYYYGVIRKNPEAVERRRKKAMEYIEKHKNDPEFLRKRKLSAIGTYQRRKIKLSLIRARSG